MKKITLLLFALVFSLAGFAQKRVTSKLPVNHNVDEGSSVNENNGFGLKGGINFSDVRSADNVSDLKSVKNFHAGAFAQFSLTKWLSLQPEILYSRKGYDSTNVERALNYFDVPLLIVLNPLDNVSLHFGPQVSLLMTVKEDGKEINKANSYQSLDYAAVGGVEARISILRLGARYNLGLREIYQDTYRQSVAAKAGSDIKNGLFQVYLGIGIR